MNDSEVLIVKLIAIGVILIAIIGWSIAFKLSTKDITIYVEKKYNVTVDKNNQYRIDTPNETFVNKDSIIFFKFNSADIQRELKEGRYYKVKVAGWRIPFLSMFRNIIKIYGEVPKP